MRDYPQGGFPPQHEGCLEDLSPLPGCPRKHPVNMRGATAKDQNSRLRKGTMVFDGLQCLTGSKCESNNGGRRRAIDSISLPFLLTLLLLFPLHPLPSPFTLQFSYPVHPTTPHHPRNLHSIPHASPCKNFEIFSPFVDPAPATVRGP